MRRASLSGMGRLPNEDSSTDVSAASVASSHRCIVSSRCSPHDRAEKSALHLITTLAHGLEVTAAASLLDEMVG